MSHATILHGSTDPGGAHFCADILWATKFRVSDPVTIVEIDGKRILFASSLEVERAQKQACVDEIVHLEPLLVKAREQGIHPISLFLRERNVSALTIPGTLQYEIGAELAKHFDISVCTENVFPKRAYKDVYELGEIEHAQRAVDQTLEDVRDALSSCVIRGDHLYLFSHSQTPLTSENLRERIEHELYKKGYLASDTIVACGIQAADPHQRGSGPLLARQPIVIDIFPRSRTSLYFTDCTRTFFKGVPSDAMIALYETVREAQEGALAKIRAGIDGFDVYTWVREYFDAKGYPTNMRDRPVYGFIHGLGHGVGLEIHEAPRIGACHAILQENMVLTVEPGLYYPRAQGNIPAGGVRIEDTVLVTEGDCKNFSQCTKKAENIIIK